MDNWITKLACTICKWSSKQPPQTAKEPSSPPGVQREYTMSPFAEANLMHFENDPLRKGEITSDSSRHDSIGNVSGEIGYGMTPNMIEDARRWKVIDKSIVLPKQISRGDAYLWLRDIVIITYARIVDHYVKVPIDNNQKDALIMFTFNLGEYNLKQLLSQPGRLNAGNYKDMPGFMGRYNKGGGRVQAGLVRRRSFEGALFAGNLEHAASFTNVFGFDQFPPV